MTMRAIFTITAGRTGTAWLADLLALNCGVDAIHEPLGINDFGERMPDVRTMRNFNNFGNNDFVRAFWDRKFATLPETPYAETNHTLAKCGLVENLVRSGLAREVTLVALSRDVVKQCVSYLVRDDFANMTIRWQWYLDPGYALNLISPAPFLEIRKIGVALWYCYEMAARQEFYRQKYGGDVRILDAALEDLTTAQGAARFLSQLAPSGTALLPAPKNESNTKVPAAMRDAVENIVKDISFDVETTVRNAISRGFTFERA